MDTVREWIEEGNNIPSKAGNFTSTRKGLERVTEAIRKEEQAFTELWAQIETEEGSRPLTARTKMETGSQGFQKNLVVSENYSGSVYFGIWTAESGGDLVFVSYHPGPLSKEERYGIYLMFER